MELSLPQYVSPQQQTIVDWVKVMALIVQGDVSLESCISQYLAPEHLTDVTCEMCSLKRTHLHYAAEVERLSHPAKTGAGSTSRSADTPHTPSHSGSFAALNGLSTAADTFDDSPSSSIDISPARRKRAKEAKKVEVRLQRMLESGTVAHYGESTLPGPPDSVPLPIKWQTSRTPSVREGLVTRPPQVLRLHLIRSEYTPYGQLLKKTARVAFPVFLDMTPFVSSGVWDQRTGVLGALQGQGQAGSRAEAQPQGQVQVQVPDQKRVIYRLSSVILHYGYTHSSGHYVCIRRKPVRVTSAPTQAGQSGVGSHLHSSSISASANVDSDAHNDGTRPDVPSTATKSCPDGCRCEDCVYFGQARELDAVPGRGWLSISDADVEEVGVEALVEARAQVSMLFYELVGEYPGPERVDDN
jgi:ubiquitin carboxyl-terminal hydrolase 1